MRLSEGNPFKTCANAQAHNLLLSRANRYENEMVQKYRDLNCSRASPIQKSDKIWDADPPNALGIGNGGGKQGRGNQPPYRRYGPDTEIQYRPRSHTDLQNPAEFSPKGKPIRNFSIDPTSSIRTRLRTPFLRTPFPRLLNAG